MNELLKIIADIVEKNIENIIKKPMEPIMRNTIGKYITKVLANKEQSTYPRHFAFHNKDQNVQSSTYGNTIPKVYGTTRVTGNLIWSKPIYYTEHQKVTTHSNRSPTVTHEYTDCYASLAIALCLGPIHAISKIWANELPLNLATVKHRIYKGTEDQKADPLILETETHSTAYKGLAYVVIEDLPLRDYNNKIPRFVFEVTSYPEEFLETHVTKNILAIHTAGNGEFTYDTTIQKRINVTTINGKKIPYGTATKINAELATSYALAGLNSLQKTLPNIQWICVTVCWFASCPDIGQCTIKPATIEDTSFQTFPDTWQVENYRSFRAHTIPPDYTSKYKGTVNDASLLRYISELKRRKYKILLLLKVVVMHESRTKLVCSNTNDVETFFDRHYKPFVEHYCNLTKGVIDAFAIASGLSKLTRIRDAYNRYPAVDALTKMAGIAKKTLGQRVIITYAADYDEYHSHSGVYNMDTLWASKNIDVVGINAYFPLSPPSQSTNKLSAKDVQQLWKSGEGYRYFYKGPRRPENIVRYEENQFAWKNILHWWKNSHSVDNAGKMETSPWKAESKKIWFIEYGFRSVENCTQKDLNPGPDANIANIDSAELNVDYTAQKTAIEGTLLAWSESKVVERMFLYAWNLQPHPGSYDTDSYKFWQTGYWVNNKISLITLSAIISDVLKNSEVPISSVETENLDTAVHGYCISEHLPVWKIIEELQSVYFFNVKKSSNKITLSCSQPGNVPIIPGKDLETREYSTSYYSSENKNIAMLSYVSIRFRYQTRLYFYQKHRNMHASRDVTHIPLVLDDGQAEKIWHLSYDEMINKKTFLQIPLPLKYLWLSVGDIVSVGSLNPAVKITHLEIRDMRVYIGGHPYPARKRDVGIFPPG
ncbi:MAG: glycoside hydrolase TIM-barrel-like domain-containing protein [Aaplasma endosymbiont of Hyalomma asiaticum]